MNITASFDNGKAAEEFHEFDFDSSKLLLVWIADQFHFMDDTLILEHRHVSALSTYVVRLLADDPECKEYLGQLEDFLTLAHFIQSHFGWPITLEINP